MKIVKRFSYNYVSMSSNYSSLIFGLVILDLVLVPYNPYILMPIFLPLVCMWGSLICFKWIGKPIFLSVAFLSVLILGISVVDETERVGDLKRAIQFISTLFYFAVAYFHFEDVDKTTMKKVCVFVGTILLCETVAFLVAGSDEFVVSLYGVDSISPTRVSNIEIDAPLQAYSRNSFMVSDPNTFAFISVMFGSLCMFFLRGRPLIFTLFCIGMAVFSTKSGSGIICFLILGLYASWTISSGSMSSDRNLVLVVVLIMTCLGVVLFLLRISSTVEEPFSYLLSGGLRFRIWSDIFDQSFPPLFGHGYHVVVQDGYLFPHSDLVGFLYRYGIVATLTLLGIFSGVIWQIKDWGLRFLYFGIPSIPFLFNSLIDHQRLFGLCLVGLAAALACGKPWCGASEVRSTCVK